MRSLPLILTLLAAVPLHAAQVYRWVDKDGVVHYSDQPAPGAELLPLTTAPKPGSVPPTYTPSAGRSSETPSLPDVRYSACEITSPSQDQTFMQSDGIPIVVETQPDLQAGDRISVSMNGTTLEWPQGAAASRIGPLPRGSYSLVASITGPDGAVKCKTATLTFAVLQPSLLTPGRQRPPR
jgi:hypothetical protein